MVYALKSDPWSSHALIFSWLDRCPPGTRILDVGTASGFVGQHCQGKGFELYGLEPAPAWAAAARPYYREVLCSDLEGAANDFLAGYAVIVLADVLEHMAQPEQQLARLLALQRPGAQLLNSVPNIANLWVRLNLLFGKFEYGERGILDQTHLRFFTRASFQRLLARQGLRVRRPQCTPVPLALVHPFFEHSRLGRWLAGALAGLTRLWPTLLGYQWVVLAEYTGDGKQSVMR